MWSDKPHLARSLIAEVWWRTVNDWPLTDVKGVDIPGSMIDARTRLARTGSVVSATSQFTVD